MKLSSIPKNLQNDLILKSLNKSHPKYSDTRPANPPKLEYLPKVLTDEQVDSICMSIRHDFGLVITDEEDQLMNDLYGVRMGSGMTENERTSLRHKVQEFYHAIYKQFYYIES